MPHKLVKEKIISDTWWTSQYKHLGGEGSIHTREYLIDKEFTETDPTGEPRTECASHAQRTWVTFLKEVCIRSMEISSSSHKIMNHQKVIIYTVIGFVNPADEQMAQRS